MVALFEKIIWEARRWLDATREKITPTTEAFNSMKAAEVCTAHEEQ